MRENFHVWSLGCIYSEIAIWIAFGRGGLQDYRRARHKEAFPTRQYGDCFHDGHDILRAVNMAHRNLGSLQRPELMLSKVVVQEVVRYILEPFDNMPSWNKVIKTMHEIIERTSPTYNHEKGVANSDTYASNWKSVYSSIPTPGYSSKAARTKAQLERSDREFEWGRFT